MTRDILFSELLKAKANKNKSVEEVIDEFIKTNSRLAAKELEAQLANLLIFINDNFDMPQATLKELIDSKILSMGLNVNPLNLEETYKKLSMQGVSLGISFDKTDIRAIEAMKNNFYWMRREFNNKFQSRLKEITQKVFEGEISRKSMAAALKEEFKSELDINISYFEGVSDHIISQNQNIARVNQARKYGAQHYKVMAIMDSKTSHICRSMNGRIIPAEHLERQADNIVGSKNIADKKAAAVWAKEPYLGRSDKMPSNFGLPPYHFRCRTEVVPVWIDNYEVDGAVMKATEPPRKGEALRHIDKMGVERYANTKTLNHSQSSRSRKVPTKDIVKALNSINSVSPHKFHQNRLVAKSDNGYFMVFDVDYLYTIYKPSGSKSAPKQLEQTFLKNSIKDKTKVIKWNIL